MPVSDESTVSQQSVVASNDEVMAIFALGPSWAANSSCILPEPEGVGEADLSKLQAGCDDSRGVNQLATLGRASVDREAQLPCNQSCRG